MTNSKIQALANQIKQLITNHANITATSSQKGHSQAGGVPQAIGDSLSAGTDNGYYSRADHVHTVDYSKIQNVPTTFAPQSHTHTKTNITNYFTSDNILANDSLNDYKTEGIYCCGYYNANQSELPTSVVSVGYILIVLNNNRQLKEMQGNIPRTYESTKQILISEDNEIFIRKYYEIKLGAATYESSEWTPWVKKDITYNADNATLQNSNNVFSIKDNGITNGKIADNTIELNKLNSSNVIDTTPTNNSNKLVTSGGVYTYIDNIIGDIDDWLVS